MSHELSKKTKLLTHGGMDTRTDAGNDDTQRPKLASDKNEVIQNYNKCIRYESYFRQETVLLSQTLWGTNSVFGKLFIQ